MCWRQAERNGQEFGFRPKAVGAEAAMRTQQVCVRYRESWMSLEDGEARQEWGSATLGKGRGIGAGVGASPGVGMTAQLSVTLLLSQLLKLGTGLLESGRHYLAASRAFIVGICDLAHLGPPEPMMAVNGGSASGWEGVWGEEVMPWKRRAGLGSAGSRPERGWAVILDSHSRLGLESGGRCHPTPGTLSMPLLA